VNAPAQRVGSTPPDSIIAIALSMIVVQFAVYRSGRNFTVRCLTCDEWRISRPAANLGDVVTEVITHWQHDHG
jgi:uncharacterized protein (DUF934 family)